MNFQTAVVIAGAAYPAIQNLIWAAKNIVGKSEEDKCTLQKICDVFDEIVYRAGVSALFVYFAFNLPNLMAESGHVLFVICLLPLFHMLYQLLSILNIIQTFTKWINSSNETAAYPSYG